MLLVVFDRVGKQVDDNLLQSGPVCADKERFVEPGKGDADACRRADSPFANHSGHFFDDALLQGQ
jgi:hypothetical protein